MEPVLLRRLSFIKYLFSIGLYQSRQPEPLYGASILFFHDSVELFLQLSLEKFNTSKASQSFVDYWDLIDKELGTASLPQKESMRRLNKARVDLKHHGIIPSKLDIESFRVSTLAFFTESCPLVFQIELDSISLIDAIKFERTRELLKQAKAKFDEGNTNECLQDIVLSFEYLLSDYEESKRDRFSRSPFFFGQSMAFPDGFGLGPDHKDRKLRNFADKVTQSISAIQKAIKILSFGIDYKKYVKYQTHVPSVQFALSGQPWFATHKDLTLNKEDLEFCIDFIVESALKLQEFDFELAL